MLSLFKHNTIQPFFSHSHLFVSLFISIVALALFIFLFLIIFVSHIFYIGHLLPGQQAWLLLVSSGEQSLVPSRPQLRSSTAGPMWRRGVYKLYPPGEHSLSTMLLFTEFLQRRHTNPPWGWAKACTHMPTPTHKHTHPQISLTLTAKEINAGQKVAPTAPNFSICKCLTSNFFTLRLGLGCIKG